MEKEYQCLNPSLGMYFMMCKVGVQCSVNVIKMILIQILSLKCFSNLSVISGCNVRLYGYHSKTFCSDDRYSLIVAKVPR